MQDTNQSAELCYSGNTIKYVANSPRINRINSEYQENKALYKTLKTLKGNLRKAQRGEKNSQFDKKHSLARPLYVISVASIQTPTPIWEKATVQWLNGEITLETYLKKTEDSDKKINCVKRVEGTDLLDRVNSALRGHHVRKVVDLLSGKEHDINTYLKGVKAWMVPTFMFHVGVIDTNVHTAMKPVLQWNLDSVPIYHPSMDENQKGQAREKSEKWIDGKIPPTEKDFLDRRISRYNDQDGIEGFWKIIQTVMNDSSQIPKDVLPQVLFNVGGQIQTGDGWNSTIHAPIYEALGENLDRFKE